MPLYMDVHHRVDGLTPEGASHAHQKDLETQEKYGLVEAPTKDAATAVHREAHGMVADEIFEVREGS